MTRSSRPPRDLPSRAEVVVVGAGPVGLTAAALLAARGVAVVVLERSPSTSDEPKAISLDDEALRVYQGAGVVDRILSVIVPGVGTRYFGASGQAVFQARAPQPYRMGYPFKNPFAQPDLERRLHEHLVAHPSVHVAMNTEVSTIEHDRDGVRVGFRRGDGATGTLCAEFALACDGGRSPVRTALAVGMTGRSHSDQWLVADVLDDVHDERYGLHYGDPRRPHVIVPGRGGRCRYEFLLQDGDGRAEDGASFELVERLLRPHRSITEDQVERAVIYRFHALVADRWRVGRVFLLGDAAHMMPPFAGQGLNSGIRDAANLCWKVSEVLSGRLDESALDSYETERRPHAEATVRLSERLGRIVMTTNPRFAERRDAYLATALRDPVRRAFFEEMRYRPVPRLRNGLVAFGAGAPGVGEVIGQPRAFDTATGSIELLDEVLGTGWWLLGVGTPPGAVERAGDDLGWLEPAIADVAIGDRLPVRSGRSLVDVDGRLDAEFARFTGRLALVRPDRVVAAAWEPGRPPDLDQVLRRARVGSLAHTRFRRPGAAMSRSPEHLDATRAPTRDEETGGR